MPEKNGPVLSFLPAWLRAQGELTNRGGPLNNSRLSATFKIVLMEKKETNAWCWDAAWAQVWGKVLPQEFMAGQVLGKLFKVSFQCQLFLAVNIFL